MNLVEERRCHDDKAPGPREIVEGLHGPPRIGQMLENLFAEHDVELRQIGRRVAEVEAGKVQRAVRLPRPLRVQPTADLDGIASLGAENGELFADRTVHRDTNPMRLDDRRTSEANLDERPIPHPRQREWSTPNEHGGDSTAHVSDRFEAVRFAPVEAAKPPVVVSFNPDP